MRTPQSERLAEVARRIEEHVARRQWFTLTEQWLGAMNPQWGELEHAHHQRVLASHPFRDR